MFIFDVRAHVYEFSHDIAYPWRATNRGLYLTVSKKKKEKRARDRREKTCLAYHFKIN